jgi:ATP-dependent DNA helicase
LDFLLSKASEYSHFIANDLKELQASMTEEAHKKIEKAERKRRKGESGSSKGKKKLKTNGGAASLQSVQEKDEAARNASEKPIFIQPPNLAADCFLKDYQLEGVRWLASLYENGVSGILADGT